MRWQLGRRSDNVEDRRGQGIPGGAIAGGGIGTILLAIVVTLLGGDPSVILDQGGQAPNAPPASSGRSAQENQLAEFTSTVLADTEDTWSSIFRQKGATYRQPKLVLFSGTTSSACGRAQTATGPFYCPLDQKIYVDLSFYQEMKTKLGAPGDFAHAYVIAHEVGHHVQNQLGILGKVQRLQQQVSKVESNQLSVRLELQADCFAGVWARTAEEQRQILEPGDIEEALNAAAAVGDDRLQQQARGYVVPDSFTHGTAAQRSRWFNQGLKTGNIEQCDTFSAARI
jgi:predicted metalloprotease